MGVALSLPRVVFGAGSIAGLANELALLGVTRPLLISDRGLESAGIVATVHQATKIDVLFLDIPENPTAAGADESLRAYRDGGCDGIVALGGGSVLDTAKLVAGLAMIERGGARDLIGKPELLRGVAPLIAIPTTVGTGSECSPVSALHLEPHGPAIGTRSALLVPRVALCDPDLARTLPRRLIAATAIDALSHCIEGFFAEPANPVIDALALDGIARVFADVHGALTPEGDAERASLMAAAFAGGTAIHKGLGPAHAVALACGDQDVHHGTLISVAIASTTRLLAVHLPAKAARVSVAMGLAQNANIASALETLTRSLGLPRTLDSAGYKVKEADLLVHNMVASPFNRTTPYVPTAEEYRSILTAIAF